MKTSEVLAAARNVLREKGWNGKGNLYKSSINGNGIVERQNFCLLGAIAFARDANMSNAYDAHPAIYAVAKAIRENTPDLGAFGLDMWEDLDLVWSWNDTICKDVDEAVHMLKRAEELALEEEANG